MFINYRNERIEFNLPFDWAKNPYKISSYPHHLMSLRWINEENFSKEQIKIIILDFYDFHFVKKVLHPYYVKIQADHCTC
ncbi:hypothetical protein DR715_09505, partial [Campylobacter jejuni]|nr:hypothetical protein [Campylobacter jejuni]